ncbi:MAG: putative addiction module antidote protein [bacterium]|nr:putative addiction module antidote protein [bacterium]
MSGKKKIEYQTLEDFVTEQFEENPELAPVFLQTVLEDYDHELDAKALLLALRHMAKANGGMTALARKTNLNRGKLYKTLSPEGNPRLKNLQTILKAFGYTLTIKPLKQA